MARSLQCITMIQVGREEHELMWLEKVITSVERMLSAVTDSEPAVVVSPNNHDQRSESRERVVEQKLAELDQRLSMLR